MEENNLAKQVLKDAASNTEGRGRGLWRSLTEAEITSRSPGYLARYASLGNSLLDAMAKLRDINPEFYSRVLAYEITSERLIALEEGVAKPDDRALITLPEVAHYRKKIEFRTYRTRRSS